MTMITEAGGAGASAPATNRITVSRPASRRSSPTTWRVISEFAVKQVSTNGRSTGSLAITAVTLRS